jgi:nitroreductase
MKNVIESMKERHSVRNYDSERTIEVEKLRSIEAFIEERSGDEFRIQLVQSDLSGVKLGTYGVIKGASCFLIGSLIENSKINTIAFGKAFEEVVLEATALGLDTCWMAGTYKMKDFRSLITLGEGEQIVIVSPLGYEAETPRKLDRFMRFAAKSNSRKPWEKLFFGANGEPLSSGSQGTSAELLEMVRIAPSSSNKQPCRVIVEGDKFHFYADKKTSHVFRNLNSGHCDGGIAMAHFEQTAKHLELNGAWNYLEPSSIMRTDLEYLGSWE